MVGTQGTLALIVDAKVRTETIPAHRGVLLLFFHRLDSALRTGVRSLRHGPVACDMMDRRLLQIARDTDHRFIDLLPREAEAMLLVEIQGESLAELNDRLIAIRNDLSRGSDGAFSAIETTRFLLVVVSTSHPTAVSIQGKRITGTVHGRHFRSARKIARGANSDPRNVTTQSSDCHPVRARRPRTTPRSTIFGSRQCR